MATKKVTANTASQELFDTPKHSKGVLTGLKVDNQHSADITVTLEDVFDTDASEGAVASPDETVERLNITVGAGLTGNIPKEELEDCKFLGVAKAKGSAVSTSCIITAIYHLE